MTPLSYHLKKWMPILCTDARWNILTALILHANERNRCWPTMDTLADLGAHGNKARATRAKKWLEAHGAIELVPSKLRVGKEKTLPGRQHVYQLTGVFKHCEDPECKCHKYPSEAPYYYLPQEVKSFDGETIKSFDGETQSITSSNPEKIKDSPSPKNGEGASNSKTSSKPKTTVVHFQDVKDHWDKETQSWDSDDYVYIGRANPHYRLPASPFQNPYQISTYIDNRMQGEKAEALAEEKARGKVIGMYEELLHAPQSIDIYNRIPELRGKTLVCWCSPEPCHGDILAKLANAPRFTPKSLWYEVIFKVFGYTGGYNRDMQKMLEGVATKKPYSEYNLDPPMRNPQDLLDWKTWFFQQPDAPPQIVEKRDKVQSSIGAWRAWRLKRLEAPQPATIPGESTYTPPADIPAPQELTDEERAAATKTRIEGIKALKEQWAKQEQEHPLPPVPGKQVDRHE